MRPTGTRRTAQPPRRQPAPDAGGATIWLLTVGLAVLAVGIAATSVAMAHLARHQARVAADLGALAAAVRVLDGPAAACARAEEFARANGGRLTACRVDGLDVQITVAVRVSPLTGPRRSATATARAGPVRDRVDGQAVSGR
ncbi:MAG TPA: Rv3654c family TadE-like protein [Micromonosporaceae bacterium]